jgi:hypothetical protein
MANWGTTMPSKTAPDNPDSLAGWTAPPENAPSAVRPDEPTGARVIGGLGLIAATCGVIAWIANVAMGPRWLIPSVSAAVLVSLVGVVAMLYHAAGDRDLQVRRFYGGVGLLALLAAVVVSLIPAGPAGQLGYFFLPYGFLLLSVGLLFVLTFLRAEDDPTYRQATVYTLAGFAAALVFVGLVAGTLNTDFLVTRGILMLALGLVFLWAAVTQTGVAHPFGFRLALAMGVVGVVMLLWGVVPPLARGAGATLGRPMPALVPTGFIFMGAGALYALTALGLASDNRLIVLTRRELAAIFYSPIAYIVLLALALIGFYRYFDFVGELEMASLRGRMVLEPIVGRYIISLVPVIAVLFVVPVLTMRSFSEEKRTGTLEVLFTAPIDEISVTLSKFFAALIYFLVLWVPWGLYLVALRAESGQVFDYRPLLGFYLVLAVTGAGFISMGLFFSSLTRNQIVAAALTFAGMVFLFAFFFLGQVAGPDWRPVFQHLSFVDFWFETLAGRLSLRDLLLHSSLTVFWLTLTVKVLEARRWA